MKGLKGSAKGFFLGFLRLEGWFVIDVVFALSDDIMIYCCQICKLQPLCNYFEVVRVEGEHRESTFIPVCDVPTCWC